MKGNIALWMPAVLLIGCASTPETQVQAPPPPPVPPEMVTAETPKAPPSAPVGTTLVVPLEARSGSSLSGKATFTSVDGGVQVHIEVAHAPPGKIATHIHETGDCSAMDAKSAGEHFNPEGHKHGLPDGEHHLGDLGNIDVDADGKGMHEIMVPGANLTPGAPDSFVGKAIIVHEKIDDGGQPAGNAGSRIGCGVIGKK